jgi:hypothetical protein
MSAFLVGWCCEPRKLRELRARFVALTLGARVSPQGE